MNRELSGACCLEWATMVDTINDWPIYIATIVKYEEGIYNSTFPFSQINDNDNSDGNADNDGYYDDNDDGDDTN